MLPPDAGPECACAIPLPRRSPLDEMDRSGAQEGSDGPSVLAG